MCFAENCVEHRAINGVESCAKHDVKNGDRIAFDDVFGAAFDAAF